MEKIPVNNSIEGNEELESIKNRIKSSIERGDYKFALNLKHSNEHIEGVEDLDIHGEEFKDSVEKGLVHVYSNDFDPESVDEFDEFFQAPEDLFERENDNTLEESEEDLTDFENKIVASIRERFKETKIGDEHDVFRKINVPSGYIEFVQEEQNQAIIEMVENTDPEIFSRCLNNQFVRNKLPIGKFSKAAESEEVVSAVKRMIDQIDDPVIKKDNERFFSDLLKK